MTTCCKCPEPPVWEIRGLGKVLVLYACDECLLAVMDSLRGALIALPIGLRNPKEAHEQDRHDQTVL